MPPYPDSSQAGQDAAAPPVFWVVWLLGTLWLATLTLWIPAYWPVAGFEISIFVLAAVTLLRTQASAASIYFPLVPWSFMVLWGGVQLLTGRTVNRFATERSICQWMVWAAFYYVAVSMLTSRRQARLVRSALVWFGCGLAVEAILQTYLSPGNAFGLFPTGYREFVMGPIVYHTHYAVLVETILPIAVFRSLTDTQRPVAFLAVSAVLLASLVVSASRGGLILGCVEVAAVVVLSRLQKQQAAGRIGWRLMALFGATALFAIIVGFRTATERFQTESLMAGRWQFALSTLSMIRVHPWIGWGLGSWPSVYPAFARFDAGAIVNQAHTDWLQWTAEGGLPAGLAMLALAGWAARPAVRSIWGIGVLAVFVHALFDYPFSRPVVGAWPILLLAMAARERESRLLRADGR